MSAARTVVTGATVVAKLEKSQRVSQFCRRFYCTVEQITAFIQYTHVTEKGIPKIKTRTARCSNKSTAPSRTTGAFGNSLKIQIVGS